MKKYSFIISIVLYFIIFVIIFNLLSFLCLSQIEYKSGYTHITNKFTNDEIETMQRCTAKNTDINTPCFKKMHEKIVSVLKTSLKKDYIFIDHARFSNNNNHDGNSYHRDIKPTGNFNGKYPNVYTCILYLDKSSVCIGNKKINVSAGDIVVFNSFYMHRGNGITPFENKDRRVLQLFHCIFDPSIKDEFYKPHMFCEHYESNVLVKYIYHFIDLRWFIEYMNIQNFVSKNCDYGKDIQYVTMINNKYYLDTVNDVKYYRNL